MMKEMSSDTGTRRLSSKEYLIARSVCELSKGAQPRI